MEKTGKNEKNMDENVGAARSASISFHIRSLKSLFIPYSMGVNFDQNSPIQKLSNNTRPFCDYARFANERAKRVS